MRSLVRRAYAVPTRAALQHEPRRLPQDQGRSPRPPVVRPHRKRRGAAGTVLRSLTFGVAAVTLLAGAPTERAAAASEKSVSPCPPPAGPSASPVKVSAIAADGSLVLADGRRLQLEGVVVPVDLVPTRALAAAAARAGMAALEGRALDLAVSGTDRHGRLLGSARLASAGEAGDLATLLVSTGAAYADGEGRCAAALLGAEDEARAARRGLWARTDALLEAEDEARLSGLVGLYAVVEGRVLAVGARRGRTYLNFGETWREDFTVIVLKADFATIFGQGQDAMMLRGERVRVRGVVREQGGPAMLPRSAAQVVRIGDAVEPSGGQRGRQGRK